MACNCGKKKTRPLGPSKKAEERSGKRYVLKTMKGTTVYGSRLEAEAAQRRAGGGQITAF